MLLRYLPLALLGVTLQAKGACIGVGCSCSVSATPINFGNYNPVSGAAVTASGNVAVTCSALLVGLNVSYVIALNAGLNGNFTARLMKAGVSSFLPYNIYTTSAMTTVWGDGTGGSSTVSDAYLLSLLSVTRNYPTWGRIPGSQVAPLGNYSDTITVTVTY